MVDELKVLLEMLGDVTDIALYIVVLFGAYKLILYLSGIGAAVLLTKLAIEKLHNWAITPKRVNIETKTASINDDVELRCISTDGTDIRVIKLLRTKIAGKRTQGSGYIHSQSADWLEDAIGEKEQRDAEEAARKQAEEDSVTT